MARLEGRTFCRVQISTATSARHLLVGFFCPTAKLSIELDGSQHGLPEQRQHDIERGKYLLAKGIEEMRFWNRQWRTNREGVLLEIWNALHRRTGCVAVVRKVNNHRYLAPNPDELIQPPKKTG